MSSKIIIVKDKEQVIINLANLIQNCANESIASNDLFKIGVSGGSLIDMLVIGLQKIETDFSKWRIFFCDERVVPENSNDSTFGSYKSKLINKVPLKEEQFIKIKQSVSASDAAEDYLQQMSAYFPEGTPRFDMLLLGMGPDGHTCSLFPDHSLLEENTKHIAFILDSPKPPPQRITLTFPVINNAKNCVFAICGKEKADMVKNILVDKKNLPCTKVKPSNGKLYWILDEEAGHLLKNC